MVDFVHIWSAEILAGDWLFEAPSLADGQDLRTSVIISLFTDRQARPDDIIPDGSDDRRGWWADNPTDTNIGSRLWLLSREKRLESVRVRAIEYARESLQWLIDDRVASSIDIEAAWHGLDRLDLGVIINRTSGKIEAYRFDWVWQQIAKR